MTVNLSNLDRVKASTDLASYTSFIYGTPKIGKTTFVHELYGDRVLFLATEKRHKVLVGAYVEYISSWPDYLSAIAQLRNPKLAEKFDVVCIDTVENLYTMLESYVLAKYGVTEFGKVEWGKDWVDLKNMWRDGIQMIEKIGYAPVYISHAIQKTERIPVSGILQEEVNDTMNLVKDKKSNEEYYEFLKYVPDLKDKVMAPINKLVDNILFMNVTTDQNLNEHRVIYLRDSLQWQAGSTFKDIKPVIPLSASEYKNALLEAIDKLDKNLTKPEKEPITMENDAVDFDELMTEARQLAMKYHTLNRMDEVNQIVDSVFGQGNKLVDATKEKLPLLIVAVEQLKNQL